MKYIRTKDGIYLNILDGVLSPQSWIGEPIAQANTIEILCDEFILSGHEPTGKPFIEDDLDFLRKARKLGYKIYGAVWTEKGLIYVAKMNDKGELELI